MLRIAAVNQDRGISPKRNKGAAVHLVAMRDAFTQLGANVEALDIPDDNDVDKALLALHQRSPLDLVYERYALGKSTGARFAQQHNIPLVLEVNAPLADEQEMFRGAAETGLDKQNDNFAFKHATRVIAVSNQVAEYARKRGAHSAAVQVCPNGIDTQRFNLQADASEIRRKLPADTFVLGFHGRERPWHGFDQLACACRNLHKLGLPVHLLVVGEGEFEALSHLPPESFTRIGWQPHEAMPKFVAAFDALPLTYQPGMPCYFSPLKLMEAMACGVVPVVPDLGDLPQTIQHDETGLVYRAGDNAGMESLLAGLVNDPDKTRRLAQRASEIASSHSWIAIAESIMANIPTARGLLLKKRQQ